MVKRRGRHPQNDLDAKKVAALVRKGTAGRHFDGNGLHLFIKTGGTASWVLRVSTHGKRRDLGLGAAKSVSLADAREAARQARAALRAGLDPLEDKRKRRATPTFEQVARSVHAEHSPSWRSPKHTAQWLSTLAAHAFPEIGGVRVDHIDVPHVLRVLTPIWLTKPETARRLRQRMRTVFDVARASGYRTGENPVGPVLAQALPRQSARTGHHAALPYNDVAGFLALLEADKVGSEVARLALRFLVLTAARTGEVLGTQRSELDLDSSVWTIPGERMKAQREHRVPLSGVAVSVLRRALELSTDANLVFPGARGRRPFSKMIFLTLLRRLGVRVTAHGFRSAFSDWCAETTGFPAEVREMALAHTIGNKTEAAYRRGDLFEKRRKLMDAWAAFVTRAPVVVVHTGTRIRVR